MMDAFCIVFSLVYFIMKICIQLYFPSQYNFLYRLLFAKVNPGRVHFLFTKIYCSRVFLTSQFDCYILTLILGFYLLSIGIANLLESQTSKALQQVQSERARQQVDNLARKTKQIYPCLFGAIFSFFITPVFFFYRLGIIKLFILSYTFICAMCHIVVNATKFKQQMLRHHSDNALQQFNKNFRFQRIAGVCYNVINLLAIVFSLFQINFSVIEIAPFAFICLQSFKAYLTAAYSLTKSYFQYASLFKRFNTQCPLVRNELQTECPICIETMTMGRKLPCQHMFHQFCLLQLINSSNFKCPMCRESFIESEQLEFRPNEYIRLNGRRFCRLLPDITIRFVRSIRPHNQVYYQMRNLFPQIPGHQIMMEMRNHPNIEQLVQRLTAIVANQNGGQPQPQDLQIPVHQAQQAAPLAGDVAPVEEDGAMGDQQIDN